MIDSRKILKNSLTVFAATALLFTAGNADAKKKKMAGKARAAFEKGDNTLALGIGIGSYYGYSNASFLPAAVASFDHGIISNVGPGTIGIGGMVGYSTARYNYYGYKDTWSDLVIGVRGTYHLTILKDKNNKFDPYGGITLGAHVATHHDDFYDETYHNTDVFIAPFIGAKYNFKPAFGVWAEVGYNITALQLGINFNF